jgi:tRNA (Thr-GGU) A37 N-methylase
MLKKVKKMAPEDFVFVLDKCSDGEKACGFTWHIELKTRPEAGVFPAFSPSRPSHISKCTTSLVPSRNFVPLPLSVC